jgi:hypothetical protein
MSRATAAALLAELGRLDRLLIEDSESTEGSDYCCCGEPMRNHGSPVCTGHSPVSMRDYHLQCLERERHRVARLYQDAQWQTTPVLI